MTEINNWFIQCHWSSALPHHEHVSPLLLYLFHCISCISTEDLHSCSIDFSTTLTIPSKQTIDADLVQSAQRKNVPQTLIPTWEKLSTFSISISITLRNTQPLVCTPTIYKDMITSVFLVGICFRGKIVNRIYSFLNRQCNNVLYKREHTLSYHGMPN